MYLIWWLYAGRHAREPGNTGKDDVCALVWMWLHTIFTEIPFWSWVDYITYICYNVASVIVEIKYLLLTFEKDLLVGINQTTNPELPSRTRLIAKSLSSFLYLLSCMIGDFNSWPKVGVHSLYQALTPITEEVLVNLTIELYIGPRVFLSLHLTCEDQTSSQLKYSLSEHI